jgi:hypothetical protein
MTGVARSPSCGVKPAASKHPVLGGGHLTWALKLTSRQVGVKQLVEIRIAIEDAGAGWARSLTLGVRQHAARVSRWVVLRTRRLLAS